MYVFADSSNRDISLYPNGSNYILHLTTPVKNVTRVELVAAKVPNTMYNYTSGTLTVNSVPYNLQPGFYTACSLAKVLSNKIGINVEFMSDQGKFIFSSNSPITLQATGDFVTLLGIVSGNSNVIQSSTIADLSMNEFVFLDIEELRNRSVVDSKKIVGNSYEGSTIATSFAMIPLDVPLGDVKTFKETSDYKMSIPFNTPISKISRLTIRWLDKNGKQLSFNGFDTNSFLLRVHCLPPPEPEPESRETEFEVLARKIERAIADATPPPKPEKNRFWIYILVAILSAAIAYFLKSRTKIDVPRPMYSGHPRMPPM